MNGDRHKSGPWSKLHAMGSLVLVLALLLNAVLPSVATASQTAPTLHQMASDHMDHAAMDHQAMAPVAPNTVPDHSDHENPAHCISSVCCYQETSAPVALVASDAFLTNGQTAEYDSDLPSLSRETKDRPPQQI